ncbi:MAG: MutS-related protein, partial [Bacteroidales bacterium]
PTAKAKTLFATHYHELNELEEEFERIKNYNIAIQEVEKRVVFLRKLVRGGSLHSFGIHVAKMAGMPKDVVERAENILMQLETSRNTTSSPTPKKRGKKNNVQLSFFELSDPVLEKIHKEIKNVDVNNLTPIDALNKLSEIQKILNKG